MKRLLIAVLVLLLAPSSLADFAPGTRVPAGSATNQIVTWSTSANAGAGGYVLSNLLVNSPSGQFLAGTGSGAAFRALANADIPSTLSLSGTVSAATAGSGFGTFSADATSALIVGPTAASGNGINIQMPASPTGYALGVKNSAGTGLLQISAAGTILNPTAAALAGITFQASNVSSQTAGVVAGFGNGFAGGKAYVVGGASLVDWAFDPGNTGNTANGFRSIRLENRVGQCFTGVAPEFQIGNTYFANTPNARPTVSIGDTKLYVGEPLNSVAGITNVGYHATSALSAPVANTPTTATTGGTLPASTSYFYKITAVAGTGETTVSNEVTVTTGSGTATNTVTVTWAAVTGAETYNVYRSTTTGTELKLATGLTTLTYTDTAPGSPSGALPTANTTGYMTATAKLTGGSVSLTGVGAAGIGDINTSASVALRLFSGVTYGVTAGGWQDWYSGSGSDGMYFDCGPNPMYFRATSGTSVIKVLANGNVSLNSNGTAVVPETINAVAGQTADLLDVNSSSGSGGDLARIDKSGNVTAAKITTTGSSVNSFSGGVTNVGYHTITALSAPVANTPSTATVGGTFPASTTVFYKVTAVAGTGETLPSNEVTVATGSGTATSTVTVTWAAVSGAESYNVYRSTTAGTELKLATGLTVLTYTDTAPGSPSGALPTANTTGNLTAVNTSLTGTVNATAAGSRFGTTAADSTSALVAGPTTSSGNGLAVQMPSGATGRALQVKDNSGNVTLSFANPTLSVVGNSTNGASVAFYSTSVGGIAGTYVGGVYEDTGYKLHLNGFYGIIADQGLQANGGFSNTAQSSMTFTNSFSYPFTFVSGPINAGDIYSNGNTSIGQIATPAAPTIAQFGTGGSTSYAYRVSAIAQSGETLASAETTTATGNASLTVTNYNKVSWTAVPGAYEYNVYGRTAGAELKLATVQTAYGNYYNDQGGTPSGALPTSNTTGNLTVAGTTTLSGNVTAPNILTSVRTVTAASDTATNADSNVEINYAGSETETLPAPAAANKGQRWTLIDMTANTVTVSNTVLGTPATTLSAIGASETFLSDGVNLILIH